MQSLNRSRAAELLPYLNKDLDVPSTDEPQHSMKDLQRNADIENRCIEWDLVIEDGQIKGRTPVRIKYPGILTWWNIQGSHLESINDFNSAQASVYAAETYLSYAMNMMEAESTHDPVAAQLCISILTSINGNIMGKAHDGALMSFLPRMKGGTRRVELETDEKKRGIFG